MKELDCAVLRLLLKLCQGNFHLGLLPLLETNSILKTLSKL